MADKYYRRGIISIVNETDKKVAKKTVPETIFCKFWGALRPCTHKNLFLQREQT